MLTLAELTDCREKLSQAQALVAAVRDVFIAGAEPALLITEITRALDDEIAALDKAIDGQP